jgi:hypothetical protein
MSKLRKRLAASGDYSVLDKKTIESYIYNNVLDKPLVDIKRTYSVDEEVSMEAIDFFNNKLQEKIGFNVDTLSDVFYEVLKEWENHCSDLYETKMKEEGI